MAYVPDEASDASGEVSHAAFKLYVCYCRHRNNKEGHPHQGLAWPDRDTIHDKTGVSITYISEAKSELISKGWIAKERGKVRLLKGFPLVAQKSDKPTNSSDRPTFGCEEKSDNPIKESDKPTQESAQPTRKSDNPTSLIKDIEPVKEPGNEPGNEPKKGRAPSGTAGGVPKRETRIPEDFSLDDRMREWAGVNAPLLDAQAETEEFKDFWGSLPLGKRSMKTDWLMTWKNRMRQRQREEGRAQRPRQRGNDGNGKNQQHPDPAHAGAHGRAGRNIAAKVDAVARYFTGGGRGAPGDPSQDTP